MFFHEKIKQTKKYSKSKKYSQRRELFHSDAGGADKIPLPITHSQPNFFLNYFLLVVGKPPPK